MSRGLRLRAGLLLGLAVFVAPPLGGSRSAEPAKAGATNAVATAATNAPTAKPAPATPAPAAVVSAPYLASVFPAGGQRGNTVEVTITGKNLLNITTVGFTGQGVTGKVVGTNQAVSARVAVTVAPEAPFGERDLRVVTAGGPSNRWRFSVGDLPEVVESEPNDSLDQAQRLAPLPVVVNAQAMMGDRDYFRFEAKAGQTIVLAAQARSLLPYVADAVPGWCDLCLTLYDAAGKVLASVDDFRFKPDPVIFFKPPQDGAYCVCAHDVLFRGRADFAYRLTIGAVPYITDIFPLGGQRGATVKVRLSGVNLPTDSLEVAIPADSPPALEVGCENASPRSNLAPFAVGNVKEAFEVEPNDATNTASRIEPPVNVNGRIGRPGDVDWFSLAAAAGQRLVFEVFARRLDSPLDSLLTLFDAAGNELAENDDTVDPMAALVTHHADSRLVYTFRRKGNYYVCLRDIQGNGGEEHAYRLAIGPEQPDFALRITPDNPRVGKGETVLLNVDAIRKDNFTNEIVVSVQDLPPGFSASQAVIATGRNQAPLTITAPPDAELGVVEPTVIGSATVGGQNLVRKAFPAESVMQAFSFTYLLPAHDLLLAVLEAAPFRVFPQVEAGQELELKPGGELSIPVKVSRHEVAKSGAISLGLARPPGGITAKAVPIPAEQNEGALVVTAAKSVRPGRYNIIVSGTLSGVARYGMMRIAPAIPLRVVAEPNPAEKK